MLMIFENGEFGKIRTLEVAGKPYFVAKDIATALGYTNPNKAVRDHCKGVNETFLPSKGGNQKTKIISEGDLYRLIIHSKLPSAEKFESWVFDEVLPQIRKHGMYATDDLLNDPDLLIKAANKIKEEQEGRLKAESQVRDLTDKVIKLSVDVNNLEKRAVKGTTLTDISCCTDTPRRLIESYCFARGWYEKRNNKIIIHAPNLVVATRSNAVAFTEEGADILIKQFSKKYKLFKK